MANPSVEAIQQDRLALSVARAVAVANESAVAQGADLERCLITIAEEAPPPDRQWRIHYGPRNYKNRRGGDLIIVVDEQSGGVRKVIHGQ